MGKHHKLSEINRDSMTARCGACGPVQVLYLQEKLTCKVNRDRIIGVRPKEQTWEENLRIRFNITPTDYFKMLENQNGRCGICGKTPEENGQRLSVDHDHKCCPSRGLNLTGTGLNARACGKCVRGLLCIGCNTLVARVERTPGLIEWVS